MKKITSFLFLLFFSGLYAQLSDFNLSLTKTNETCLSNGSITFNVSNTTQGASMLYKVYQLPNTTTPLAILTENYIGGLTAADYKVVATQSLGAAMNTKEKTVTITNQIVPFAFNFTASNTNCQSGGAIIVNTTSGTFASCEILSGPQIRPMQTSNIFNDLPSGTYNIRVFNTCGEGKVKTYSLSVVSATLNVSGPSFTDTGSCQTIQVSNTITSSAGSINYPLTVKHTLNTMGINGTQPVHTQVFTTGNADALTVSMIVPRDLTNSYTYDIEVTDNCNTTYQFPGNTVDPSISLALNKLNAPCAEKYLELTASKYTGTYTVEFLSAPIDFNPAAFNTTPAGPFAQNSVVYGSEANPVPFGIYEVKITDSCGRTATQTINIEFILPTPSASGVNNGCYSLFGKITISVPPQQIVEATIIAAPTAYTANNTLEQDVTGNINANGTLVLPNLPLGYYTITFKDDCGFEYEKKVKVPEFVEKDHVIATQPSCGPDFGGVTYSSGNGNITNIKIIDAPDGFNQELPYDVSQYIVGGKLYLADLPVGDYIFKGTDICGLVKELPVSVIGYTAPVDAFTYTAGCGTFSVKVDDNSNGTQGAAYWLQKYFPETNTWGHPGNGSVYAANSTPTNTNGIALTNQSERNNLGYTGKFRIVKKFETITTGSKEPTICVSVLGEFTYTDVLKIEAAYSLSCNEESPNDVLLEVTGQPISYKIIKKDNQPFVIDNGSSNLFANLIPAEYVFSIEDICGNVVTQWFDIHTVPALAQATQPDDMVLCVQPGETLAGEFHLTDQTPDVLGLLHAAMFTVTYHLTFEDADTGVNALPEYYTNVSNGQTLYARVIHNDIALCHGVTSFKLHIGLYQQPVILTTGTICNEGELTLAVSKTYDRYEWSTGETTRSIKVTEGGTYTVRVWKNYGTGECDGENELVINVSAAPKIKKIDTEDWTDDQNSITVHLATEGDYEYSIDGLNFQTENVFTGLETGTYKVYVRDTNGCGYDIQEVVLLNYPRFFTPNGDGIHDTWYIPHSVHEPHIFIRVMDRYGKLITTFGSTSKGWDGTLNGIQLPSTDYWFVVTREDGRELRGHFSMVR